MDQKTLDRKGKYKGRKRSNSKYSIEIAHRINVTVAKD